MSDGTEADIIQSLKELEEHLIQRLIRLERQLALGSQVFRFFEDGLQAHHQRNIAQSKAADLHAHLLSIVSSDPELRFPHRKILEFLSRQYDFRKALFQEVHFSALVKATRVGKNMAKAYLTTLIGKGHVEERRDGYRAYYRLSMQGLESRPLPQSI